MSLVRSPVRSPIRSAIQSPMGAAFSDAEPSQPFTAESDTYFWDFLSGSGNLTEATGADTLSYAPELVNSGPAFAQSLKADQPLVVAGGIDFNQDTDRIMELEDPSGIANGTDGYYIGVVATFTTADSYLFEISRAGATKGSRCTCYLTGSRTIGLKGNTTDSNSVSFVGTSVTQLDLATEYLIELVWDTVNDTIAIYVDQVEVTTENNTYTSASSFPSSDPAYVRLGNTNTLGKSCDATLRALAFRNQPAIDTAASDYLLSLKAA